jgi:very-short-patch-repair endonuclease/DNA polymerase III delta prime subunit
VTGPDPTALFDKFVVGETALRLPLVRKRPGKRERTEATDERAAEEDYVVEPGDLTFDAGPRDLLRRLRRIYDNARTTVEERGVTTLYLTFGALRWEDPMLGESIAPLWMVPCEFESFGPNAPLRLSRADDEMQLNPALELYLRERQKITLPAITEDPNLEDWDKFVASVRACVREQGWAVSTEIWLSTYTFESLVIYQDLKAMADVALTNGTVAALARARSIHEVSEGLGEEIMDALPTPDKIPLPVLPTDSSQLKALAIASSGRNLVIHGPPGTGKSQTISNLIAVALGQKKKVLFVSAKMAALNVVYDRLAKLGVGRFCLEAHSTKAGKAKIIEELKRALDADQEDGALDKERLDELIRLRGQLNEYVAELHRKIEPIGRSIYQIIGRLEKLSNAPDVKAALPWEDLVAVTRADLANALDALRDLGVQADVFDSRAWHPWRGFAVQPGAGAKHEEIEKGLRTILRGAGRLHDELAGLSVLFGPDLVSLPIGTLRTLVSVFESLSHTHRLPKGWGSRPLEELTNGATLFESAAAQAKELASKKAQYDKVLPMQFREAIHLLTPAGEKFTSWLRVFDPAYWRWRSSVIRQLRPGAPSDFASLRMYLMVARRLGAIEAWFERQREALLPEIEGRDMNSPEVLGKIAEELRVASTIRGVIASNRLTGAQNSPQIGVDIRRHAAAAVEILRDPEVAYALSKIDTAWPQGFVDGRKSADSTLSAMIERSQQVLAALPKMHEWIVLQHTLSKCGALGLAKFIDALGSISAWLARPAFERRFYTLWLNAAIQRSPVLAVFSGLRREEQIEQFRLLDTEIQKSARGRVRAVGSEPARRIATAQSGSTYVSEVSILRRELEKRRRIKPLRKLFSEIPNALQALKPCMLMSPLSVSTFLKPGSVSFDLVVFDEASQLPTQEAIPAILRANQVVVAGDANQLPPTSFFDASIIFDEYGDEEETDEWLEPLESLLDDCVAINPAFERTHLRWHYRSRDERLIKFSNHYFYENALITFPSVSANAEGQGVRLEYLPEGVWDRGRSRTNRREARRTAELVVEQFECHPDRSVGVVAMNVTQREAIEDSLSELIEGRPYLSPLLDSNRPEPFFVKSLENVQGDERDTMIISVGYGKSSDGALSLNFGPLNREGGWRRLNVLVTRAKWQTILVTSMRSHELAAVNPNNKGAVALRNFLAYAESNGRIPGDGPVLPPGETNDFEDAVAEALRERGLEVDQQVGASQYRIDLAIRDPRDRTRYILGIECDGATYHSSRTARDRDLLRQQILRGQGWRLHRVWSTDWFRDKEKALKAVLRSLKIALEARDGESPPAPGRGGVTAPSQQSKPRTIIHSDTADDKVTNVTGRRFRCGVPYQKYKGLGAALDREHLLDPNYLSSLAQRIAAIVRTEGPIHLELLVDRLKEMHGVARAGSNVQRNVDRAVESAERNCGIERRGNFLKARGSGLETFRIPGEGVHRHLALVPPEEIELAILYIVEDQFGFQRDALPRAVAEVFGFERTSAGLSELVGDVVDDLVEHGKLRLSGINVYLP